MKICLSTMSSRPNGNLKFKIVNSRQGGFSIIELVFAMSFLVIIVFGVISLQSGNLAMANRQINQINAEFYANQGVQILKSLGYKSDYANCNPKPCEKKINFILNTNEYELLNLGGDTEKIADTIFERYVEIDPIGLNNAYKAIIYIEWDDSTGPHRRASNNSHVEAKTIISNN